MNFEEIQKLWEAQSPAVGEGAPDPALLARIKAESAKFATMIRRRDRRELVAGIFYAVVFLLTGLLAWKLGGQVWLFVVAAGAMLGVCAFLVGEKTLAARRDGPTPETLLGNLKADRRQVARQIWLLRNVAWWYLFPAQLGWLLFYLGILVNLATITPLVYIVLPWRLWRLWTGGRRVYRLNQDAVEKSLLPRLRELDALREELAGE